MYYFGTMVHIFVFIILGVMFSFVIESEEMVPKLIVGTFFSIMVVLITIHFNRQVHIRIVDDRTVDLRTLLKQVVVPLKDIGTIKPIWINTYKLRVNGKLYVFIAFKNEVKYFKEVIDKAKSEAAD